MNSNITKKLMLLLMLLAIFNLFCFRVKASYSKSLNDLVLKCYKTRSDKDCITALTYLESIQVDAANRNAYRCQTHAIGMESNLVLALLNSKRLESPKKDLYFLAGICKLY